MPLLGLVDGMPGIDWPAVRADGLVVAQFLNRLLPPGMASGTERLQLAEVKAVRVAVMRLDVVSNRRGRDHALGEAHCAQRVMHQLQPGTSLPEAGAVETSEQFVPPSERRRGIRFPLRQS
jgi:hypothetical protein